MLDCYQDQDIDTAHGNRVLQMQTSVGSYILTQFFLLIHKKKSYSKWASSGWRKMLSSAMTIKINLWLCNLMPKERECGMSRHTHTSLQVQCGKWGNSLWLCILTKLIFLNWRTLHVSVWHSIGSDLQWFLFVINYSDYSTSCLNQIRSNFCFIINLKAQDNYSENSKLKRIFNGIIVFHHFPY